MNMGGERGVTHEEGERGVAREDGMSYVDGKGVWHVM